MSTPIISIHAWVALPNEVRYRIRAIFNMPRSSNTVVNDGVIETDGTTYEDFKTLTIEKMQAYLGNTETDFHKLFDGVVAKINDELSPKVAVIVEPVVVAPVIKTKKINAKKK